MMAFEVPLVVSSGLLPIFVTDATDKLRLVAIKRTNHRVPF